MPSFRKSVIVAHPAEVLFELVDRFEAYPEFLPGVKSAAVLSRDDRETRGRLGIDYKGFTSDIATVNRKVPGRSITLELLDGPFEHFEGLWTFKPLGEGGCRVELQVDYRFAGRAMQLLLTPIFGRVVQTVVDRFVARADEESK